MKSWGQIVLAIVAVVALVAGITFIKQYQVGSGEEPAQSPGKIEGVPREFKLNFPVTIWEWDPPSDGQFEQQTQGWHDFWFQNDNDVALNLGLRSKSCKCSEVSMVLLPREEAANFRKGAGAKAAPERKLNLQSLEVDEFKGANVPSGSGGLVRLAWEDKKDKSAEERSERLSVDLWTQSLKGGPKTIHHLEIPVTFVPALRRDQFVADLYDLNLKEEKTALFRCWSSTRPQFSLTAKSQMEDPCITCSCIPLTDPERNDLENTTKSRVLCGYKVRVTVRERLSDTMQMELGPFSRRILLTSDPGIDPTGVIVTGVVRGDVTVGADDDKGQIALGLFPARNGITRTVRLIAHRPDLELRLEKVESLQPPHLQVKSLHKMQSAQAGGRTSWELCVEVPPGSPAGRLDRTAVLLSIAGNSPRHIRIPVTGSATQ